MAKNKKEYEIGLKRNEQQDLRKRLRENLARLETLKMKIASWKMQLTTLKTQQLKYYHKLLYEGKEARQEGLAWIVKAIWVLGQDVNLSQLPPFLDPPAIEYLFKVGMTATIRSPD